MSLLPFAEKTHPVWSSFAAEIHAAVWDSVGLEKVQEFVRKWASNHQCACDEYDRLISDYHRVSDENEPKIYWSMFLGVSARRCAELLPKIAICEQPLPQLPQWALPPRHGDISLSEKWAGLAAIHDVFWKGAKINPYPEPKKEHDLDAFTTWMKEGGALFMQLMERAKRMPRGDKNVVERWLRGVTAEAAEQLRKEDVKDLAPLGFQMPRTPKQPPPPAVFLSGWREILVNLGLHDNQEDRQKVRRLSKSYFGPIIFPGQGKQPFVNKAKLLEWWAGLEAKVQADRGRQRDAQATAENQHNYGRNSEVIPDVAGGVKKRRQDWTP